MSSLNDRQPFVSSILSRTQSLRHARPLHGDFIKHIKYGDELYPSAVVPTVIPKSSKINIELGVLEVPYLKSTNSILLKSIYKEDTLRIQLKAFIGHRNLTKVVSPSKPIVVKVNGRDDDDSWSVKKVKNSYEIEIRYDHNVNEDEIIVEFEKL